MRSLSRLFNLEIEILEFETLADFHVDYFCNVLIVDLLNRLTRSEPRPVDKSFSNRVKFALARRIAPRLKAVFNERTFRPRGHSVTAVYRKPAD